MHILYKINAWFFEIAVDQQTKTCDETFEGVPDPNHPPVPAVQPRQYLLNFWPNSKIRAYK